MTLATSSVGGVPDNSLDGLASSLPHGLVVLLQTDRVSSALVLWAPSALERGPSFWTRLTETSVFLSSGRTVEGPAGRRRGRRSVVVHCRDDRRDADGGHGVGVNGGCGRRSHSVLAGKKSRVLLNIPVPTADPHKFSANQPSSVAPKVGHSVRGRDDIMAPPRITASVVTAALRRMPRAAYGCPLGSQHPACRTTLITLTCSSGRHVPLMTLFPCRA